MGIRAIGRWAPDPIISKGFVSFRCPSIGDVGMIYEEEGERRAKQGTYVNLEPIDMCEMHHSYFDHSFDFDPIYESQARRW